MKKYMFGVIIICIISIMLSCTLCETKALQIPSTNLEKYQETNENSEGILPVANVIVWAVRAVGMAISVIMLMIIGIKYVIGSVEEKANYKQTMWPYVLGALLIFAGSAVVNVIYEMLQT